jgi:hypothetical protein
LMLMLRMPKENTLLQLQRTTRFSKKENYL